MYYKYNDSFWSRDKILVTDRSTVLFSIKFCVIVIIFITDRLFINQIKKEET